MGEIMVNNNNNNKGVLFLVMCVMLASSVFGIDAPNPVSPAQGTANLPAGNLFTWTPVSGAEGYVIELDTDPAFGSMNNILQSVNNAPTPDTILVVKDLNYGQAYYWRVYAYVGAVNSIWSSTFSFSTGTAAPGYVSPSNNATNISGGATLIWNAHDYVNLYDYQVDTSSAFNSAVLSSGSVIYAYSGTPSTVQVNFGAVFFGKKHYWRVRSRNIAGNSSWSNTRNFTTTTTGPGVSSPADGAANILGGVLLNWNAHQYVAKYQFQTDTINTFNSPALSNGVTLYTNTDNNGLDTQAEVGNLFYNTTHYWRVRSITTVDTSAWGIVRSFTTTANGPVLTSPANGAANIKAGLTLDWNAHNYSVFYDYQYDTVPTFNSPALLAGLKNYMGTASTNTDTKATISDLYYGKTYYWRVRARNTRDASPWTTQSFTVDSTVKVTGPVNGTSNIQGAPTIDWESHYFVVGYEYQYDTVPDFTSAYLFSGTTSYLGTSNTGVDTKHTLFSFLFGQTYYWRARSMNLSDTSKWTAANSFSITPEGPIQIAPSNLSTGVSTSGITIDWNHQLRVTGYLLQVDKTDRFDSPALLTFNKTYINATSNNPDTEQLISPLDANTVYFWRVQTYNAVDSSDWSASWVFSTGFSPIIMPSIPMLSLPSDGASNQNLNMIIDWDAVSNIDFYDFEIDTVNTFSSSWKRSGSNAFISGANNNSDTEHILNNLSSNKTYFWKVRTRTAFSNSPWSTIWSFTTLGVFTPDVPVLISPTHGSTVTAISVLLNWDAAPVASYYDLEMDKNINFNSPALITVTKNFINSSSSNPDTEHLLNNLSANTTYFWRVRARTGSTSSAWSGVWVFNSDGTTGIKDNNLQSSNLNIYPNPTNGMLNLQIPEEMYGEVKVLVYSQNAMIVHSEIKNKTDQTTSLKIDLSGLPAGQYFIKMYSKDKILSQKFIKVN